MAKIDAFFKLMDETGASDLHLVAGSQPILRVRGELERVKYDPLDSDELKAMLYEIAPEFKIASPDTAPTSSLRRTAWRPSFVRSPQRY